MNKDTLVIAIGGNALIKNGQKGTIYEQFANARETCSYLANLARDGYNIVLTHGNGPQVGYSMRRNEMARDEVPPLPLGLCVAESQGSMGYMLQQVLRNKLREMGVNRRVVTIITQVIVDEEDPSFNRPTKPIGQFFKEEDIKPIAEKEEWDIIEDSGRGWRRVVSSPKPLRIVEMDIIRSLVKDGHLVIACGGGGLPVTKSTDGNLDGVEAVIDKDRASAQLAIQLGVEKFMILTSVERVALNYGKSNEIQLDEITVAEARKHLSEGHFAPGSMAPKVESAIKFLENGGKEVIITDIHLTKDALEERAGTRIRSKT